MPRYKVVVEKNVIKFLQSHNDIAKRFFDKAEIIEKDFNSSLLNIKKLIGSSDAYRLRIGKYRFLFRMDRDEIIIYFYDADSRGGIYK